MGQHAAKDLHAVVGAAGVAANWLRDCRIPAGFFHAIELGDGNSPKYSAMRSSQRAQFSVVESLSDLQAVRL
jgi:hypothetical protein